MKNPLHQFVGSRRSLDPGWTLVEVMVAMAVGSLVLTAIAMIWVFGARSFVAISNYVDLDAKSRIAVDRMSRELREAEAVLGFQNTGTSRWLRITNAEEKTVTRYSWDAASRNLVSDTMGSSPVILLTECDNWDFNLFQRTPVKNTTNLFYVATNYAGSFDATICKTVTMSWKCSRRILGQPVNTESIQTAQVVLRNKH